MKRVSSENDGKKEKPLRSMNTKGKYRVFGRGDGKGKPKESLS